jgi:hypothetical protein
LAQTPISSKSFKTSWTQLHFKVFGLTKGSEQTDLTGFCHGNYELNDDDVLYLEVKAPFLGEPTALKGF